ncbi:alpha/beta hydrolase [Aquincola tertiaricarbonis]|uniref:Alpha/beta hydrolase n=1 Tax=Aquincola tertiaricarbonis TaxID=391953 RepID=A0ABY4SB73_AQUTE|nr:alpha/beta hydrolase family protein [Aquincola tertiaricarbonis]URI10598.1 alpha/beta hydrolase [Aquincola tertiaricarbonis]
MDYVLVHGAWHGAWCWRRVLPGLWAAGHRAFAVSLTGVGERAHLLRPDINLQTHADDVCAVIEAEELQAAVLVGHSYGGIVITAVADRLAERLSHLVYLDAVVPEPGESWSSGHTPETQAARRAAIAATGTLPPADPAAFGLQGEDAAWVARRQTPQPGGVYDDLLHFDAQRINRLPRTFIDCTSPALATIDVMRRRVRAAPGWQVVEIATGHDPMVSAPDALLAALLAVG